MRTNLASADSSTANELWKTKFSTFTEAVDSILLHPKIRENLATVTKATLALPQAKCPVIHRFGPGLYIREVFVPADTFSIGRYQKFDHLNVMLAGRVRMLNEDGAITELVAPAVFVGKPGQKVGYIVEDMVWQNIYATTETDLEKLESLFMDKSDDIADPLIADEAILAARADFRSAIAEFGFSEDQVKLETEHQGDRIPFPYGGYKVMVADSQIDGKGMFATADIADGELIAPASIGGRRTPAGRYVNHSPTPNAEFITLPNGDANLVSISSIKGSCGGMLGDEITTDYRCAMKMRRSQCPE